jgi:hypothetical protein
MMSKGSGQKRVDLFIDDRRHERLRLLARTENRTIVGQVRALIDAALAAQPATPT